MQRGGDTTSAPPRPTDEAVSLFADVPSGDGGEIRINAYGAFCDLKVVEQSR